MVKPKKMQKALRKTQVISEYRGFMKTEVKHGKRKIWGIKEEEDMGCQPGAHTEGDREVTEAGGEGGASRESGTIAFQTLPHDQPDGKF